MEEFRSWKKEGKEDFEKEKTKLFLEGTEKVIKKEHNKVKTYPIDPIECNPKVLNKKGDN